ncbi:calcium-binding protein [Paenibacillus sp. S-38]|uniref:calcium-binding protein n=1 Tax=Paenibacillus sp. S-38 TaxID=3416710 RepID=UPI003CFA0A91
MAGTTEAKLIFGTQENDVLVASGVGGEHLFALAGDDVLAAASQSNVLHGGDGSDTIGVTGSSNTLYGEGGNDRLLVTSGENAVHGNDGNDQIEVRGSSNLITGGAGSDRLQLLGSRNEVSLGAGDDVVRSEAAGLGDPYEGNTVNLGAGNDFVSFEGLRVSGSSVRGGEGNESFSVSESGGHRIDGEAGDDSFTSYHSEGSFFIGGSGNDTFVNAVDAWYDHGNVGNTYHGDGGNDQFAVSGIYNVYKGGNGEDTLTAVNYSSLEGTAILGEGGNDTIQTAEHGDGGYNRFDGGAGQDTLTSALGFSELFGGSGNDVLTTLGSSSNNWLSGGQGEDRYVVGSVLGSSLVADYGNKGEQDTLVFADLGRDDLSLSRDGANLVFEADGQELIVDRFFVNGSYRIERFELADGTVWTDSDVEKIIQAMAAAPASGGAGEAAEAAGSAQELSLLLAAGGAPALA